MHEPFTIEDGRTGPQWVLQSSWSEDVRAYMRSHGITELQLNDARGFVGDDISFVATRLEEVLFYGSTLVEDGDLRCLTRLPNLENLAFQNRRHDTHRREELEQS